MSEYLRIVAAAVQYNGITFSLPAPARHGDILTQLFVLNEDAAIRCTQGFLTSEGKFVNRIAAREIALASDQRIMAAKMTHPDELFSEDVW